MKALHLNLASRPYRDYRPVWMVVTLFSVMTLVLMVNNGRTAYRFFVNTQDTRAEIAELEAKTASERGRADELQRRVDRVNSLLLQGQVSYVNAQIAERSLSWSRLLDHLEDVFPNEVKLANLNPSISPDGPIVLNITCIAKTNDGLVDIIRSMNADPHFERPLPTSESTLADGNRQFQLSVEYLPVQSEEIQ